MIVSVPAIKWTDGMQKIMAVLDHTSHKILVFCLSIYFRILLVAY